MNNEDKYFIKAISIIALLGAIVFCCIWAVQLVIDSNNAENHLTECESSCYPDDVKEDETSCTCLPPVEAR